MASAESSESLRRDLAALTGSTWIEQSSFVTWPADLFAITSQVLSQTGLYTRIIDLLEWHSGCHGAVDEDEQLRRFKDLKSASWPSGVRAAGEDWAHQIAIELASMASRERAEIAERVGDDPYRALTGYHLVERLLRAMIVEVTQYSRNDGHTKLRDFHALWDERVISEPAAVRGLALLQSLHAIADEACGFLLSADRFRDSQRKTGASNADCQPLLNDVYDHIRHRLRATGSLSSISTSACRVLPKNHTPNVGQTLRTFSAHVGFHRSSVEVKWRPVDQDSRETATPYPGIESSKRRNAQPQGRRNLTILLLPWPMVVNASDFYVVSNSNVTHSADAQRNLFGFAPAHFRDKDRTSQLKSWLQEVIKDAKRETPTIDLVVMPECAIHADDIDELENLLFSQGVSGYSVGVTGKTRTLSQPNANLANDVPDGHLSDNYVCSNFQVDGHRSGRVEQHKHHRWHLSASQIAQFQLGSVLPSGLGTNWWEGIRVRRRSITFFELEPGFMLCPLICEDLARQDPIADLIRTVGPSLVISLLLDGPQLSNRWSARYASVLADDPGGAVLTLTSYGMVRRTHPMNISNSRTIALWRDATGVTAEITLPQTYRGVLLSVSISRKAERMVDGRSESGSAAHLRLSGVWPVGRPGRDNDKVATRSEKANADERHEPE